MPKPKQTLDFPATLRRQIAALDLSRETGHFSQGEHDEIFERLVDSHRRETVDETGKLMDAAWKHGPTDPEEHYPNGRQLCWWKEA